MSQRALNPRQFKHLYHESHLNDRESIQREGLRANKPFTPQIGEDVYPHGVYLSTPKGSEYGSSVHDSSHFGYDRWRVNMEGLEHHKDPDPLHETSYYTPQSIPPERLKLVKKGHPDWERHI
jgi:hypothetical protein